ncbi:ABC transporter permease [Nonomuraea muscovyensis]|uniref:Transport permease protein n=1 Tax=Nonomuraea muscovyensis TaxID=1124761 RepID=A0A7X0C3I1_9ACTN|nr:ABC transporter permease [Nonomuraea muscovyensis]MBB6347817.1 ABC-2 type transport system permease protein [Nonomuraea muscovyensis]MDF2709795.1 type transporter [Nonomuraea muscovyensis]
MTEVGVLAGRTMRRFLRTPQLVISGFAFPVLLMFTILPVYGGLVGDGYIQRFAPLIVLSTVTFGMAPSAVGLFTDLREGIFDRLRTMPVGAASTLAGRLLGDVLRMVAVAVVAVAVAHVPGFRFSGGVLAALAFFGLIAAVGAMCMAIALFAALSAASVETVRGALEPPTTLVFFLCSGFVPLEAFPGWLQPVVRVNPLSTASEALRRLAGGEPAGAYVLFTLAWAAGAGVIFGVLSVRRYRRRVS